MRVGHAENESGSGTERQNLLANLSEKTSLIFYFDMKPDWARVNSQFAVHEMNVLWWHGFKTDVWKLRGGGRDFR